MKYPKTLSSAELAAMPRITPSKPDYYRGTRVGDDRLTREQVRAAVKLANKRGYNIKRYGLPEEYTVSWKEESTDFPRRTIKKSAICPVTSCSRDRTSICVIAPNGMEMWTPWSK